jgi:trehalose/maltose hydrolase-like predicted phosphorylase
MNNIYLPKPNENGIIEQFSGYFDLEDVSIVTLKTRLKHPNEYWGGKFGVASSTKIIKQADVVTMLVLFPDLFNETIKRANFEYYFSRTEHGSSLSSSMYGLLALQLHNIEYGYQMFLKSSQADLDKNQKLWAGKVYIGGTHPASAGGAYQCFIYGFMGLKIKDDSLVFTPTLPSNIQNVKFNYHFRGNKYQLIYKENNIEIREMEKKDD